MLGLYFDPWVPIAPRTSLKPRLYFKHKCSTVFSLPLPPRRSCTPPKTYTLAPLTSLFPQGNLKRSNRNIYDKVGQLMNLKDNNYQIIVLLLYAIIKCLVSETKDNK